MIRLIRPQKISVTRMWVTPIFLVAITVWVIYLNDQLNPAPPYEIAIGVVIGAACGIPFGVLRGLHTDVRPTERKGVMYLGSSWITLLVFLAAFGLRAVVRALIPQHGSLAGTVGDALLGFAIAFIIASYVLIFRKYERLAGQASLVANHPSTPLRMTRD